MRQQVNFIYEPLLVFSLHTEPRFPHYVNTDAATAPNIGYHENIAADI
ncbi:MAG: hypothetical protein KatS3mg031_0898 [Chitinophagales bacterium]|nr:MAG: hypothetical protein KatS3mg031_0898 [Chitinophagales bacterium]